MKKYLVFTLTSGNGHNSAAMAVKESLEKQGATVKVVDVLKEYCSNKLMRWSYEKGYLISVTYLNDIFSMMFYHYQKADPKKYYKSPIQTGLSTMYSKILKEIYDFQPDAIYCTHFLPCVLISNLRKIYPIPCKVYSFIFDYIICPFWEAATGIDYLLVPNESFIPTLLYKGFTQDQLLPYGLTANEKFSEHMDKSLAREKLGIDQQTFTIFVMFGGGFWKGNYQIVKNIVKHYKQSPIQIIVANGMDKNSKRKIDKLQTPPNIKILNFGFSKEVDLYMSAADVIVGKAGGVSITELLNKRLPLICCHKLPVQEIANISMLTKEGVAKQYKRKKQLIKLLEDMQSDPQIIATMQQNIDRIRRPDATKRLVNDMLNCTASYKDVPKDVDYSKVKKQVKSMLRHKGQVQGR